MPSPCLPVQFKSPIILILPGAGILSYFLADRADAIIIAIAINSFRLEVFKSP